ncbi:MAG: hypothetical protein AB2L24_01520 [Mangrovibacterium sp.]
MNENKKIIDQNKRSRGSFFHAALFIGYFCFVSIGISYGQVYYPGKDLGKAMVVQGLFYG